MNVEKRIKDGVYKKAPVSCRDFMFWYVFRRDIQDALNFYPNPDYDWRLPRASDFFCQCLTFCTLQYPDESTHEEAMLRVYETCKNFRDQWLINPDYKIEGTC